MLGYGWEFPPHMAVQSQSLSEEPVKSLISFIHTFYAIIDVKFDVYKDLWRKTNLFYLKIYIELKKTS